MEAIHLEQKRETGIISINNSVVSAKEQHTDLKDFLKGTISGEELVKYVCDRLDEKYIGKKLSCSI